MAKTPAETGFRAYGAAVIRQSLGVMLSHHEGVHAAEDIEAVHDMRVGSRRLRAAIGVFHSAFEDPYFAVFEREVKAVTDALGEARDLDVMIDALQKETDALPEEERGMLQRLVESLKKQRAQKQKGVSAALNRLEEQNLQAMFEGIVERIAARDLLAFEAAVHAKEAPDGETAAHSGA